MGASLWSYMVDYQKDVQSALDALRERVFGEGEYYLPAGWPRPDTIDALYDEDEFYNVGTHTILDVRSGD